MKLSFLQQPPVTQGIKSLNVKLELRFTHLRLSCDIYYNYTSEYVSVSVLYILIETILFYIRKHF